MWGERPQSEALLKNISNGITVSAGIFTYIALAIRHPASHDILAAGQPKFTTTFVQLAWILIDMCGRFISSKMQCHQQSEEIAETKLVIRSEVPYKWSNLLGKNKPTCN